jgi:adenylate cyclase, class 2
MSVEIEIKYRLADRGDALARVLSLGATQVSESSQADTYFSHPARDFRRTDEALRLRIDSAGNHLTYKGPKREGPTKTREEIEIPLGAGPECEQRVTQLLSRLGFQAIITIAKSRSLFQLNARGRPLQVALDEVRDLGAFAEVECIAETEADVPAAQEAVLALARQLNLTAVEPRTYLRMALEQQEG